MVWKIGEGDAYALLGELLAETGEVDPLPGIARTEKGKPYFPGRPGLHFSVSHSGELALCALGEGALGADVERVRKRGADLPRYALSDGEYAWFLAQGERWEDFYTLWTMKEARVKCTGEGIFHRSVRRVSVPLIKPGERARWEGFVFTALAGEVWRGAICEENS